MVTVAEILKNGRLAIEQSKALLQWHIVTDAPAVGLSIKMAHIEHSEITTGLDAFNDDGRERAVQKPKMEILLRKAESFDQVMAQQTRPSALTTSDPPVPAQQS